IKSRPPSVTAVASTTLMPYRPSVSVALPYVADLKPPANPSAIEPPSQLFCHAPQDINIATMPDPDRLPPPPFWRTRYFALTVLAKADRRWIDPLDVLHALRQPVRRERQADGRIRYWA